MHAEVTSRLRELHTTIEAGDIHRQTVLTTVAQSKNIVSVAGGYMLLIPPPETSDCVAPLRSGAMDSVGPQGEVDLPHSQQDEPGLHAQGAGGGGLGALKRHGEGL